MPNTTRTTKEITEALAETYHAAKVADHRMALPSVVGADRGSFSDYEWGIICGKLQAIQWVLGGEWPSL